MKVLPGGAPFSPPEPLEEGHRFDQFDCGKAPLNDWIHPAAQGLKRFVRVQGLGSAFFW